MITALHVITFVAMLATTVYNVASIRYRARSTVANAGQLAAHDTRLDILRDRLDIIERQLQNLGGTHVFLRVTDGTGRPPAPHDWSAIDQAVSDFRQDLDEEDLRRRVDEAWTREEGDRGDPGE